MRPVVRTVDHDVARIKQLLDGGAQTLMVPMVETAADAEKLVRAMRYPFTVFAAWAQRWHALRAGMASPIISRTPIRNANYFANCSEVFSLKV